MTYMRTITGDHDNTVLANAVLRVHELTVSFRMRGRWTSVIRNLNFDLRPNETLAVVGESGSGKSVTALSIMRLVPEINSQVEGQIEFNGQSLLELSEDRMRQIRGNDISIIFQEPMTSLNPVLTVGFQIAEVLQYHRGLDRIGAEQAALRLLDQVRIPTAKRRLHDYPHQFSGGMRQRVMIAMALACRPRLLIADEPTTALDVTVQAQILDLIKMLQHEIGMSVLFITHDMGVVAEIADRVLVMNDGEKVESGMVAHVFESPKHPYTKTLLDAVPRLGSMAGTQNPEKFTERISSKCLGHDSFQQSRSVTSSTQDKGASPPDRPILEVAGLSTHFDVRTGLFGRLSGRVHAVEDISFALRRGETLALVGESGCGKSTLGRSLLRLVEPTIGTVLFDGDDVLNMTARDLRRARQHMQIVFQDPYASLNPRKMVGTTIAEPMLVHGLVGRSEAEERVADLLTRVGLAAEHGTRYPHEFSGGQRQRICIARALALDPKLIVADEVVSALDVSVQAQVINLLMQLQVEWQLSYLFISHDIAVVERVAHRVAVMYLGEIVEIGPRQAIFEHPQHPYTKKLLEAVPVLDPSRRHREPKLLTEEIPNPFHPVGYRPRPKIYNEVEPGHYVQHFG